MVSSSCLPKTTAGLEFPQSARIEILPIMRRVLRSRGGFEAGAKATMGRVDLGHAPAAGGHSYYEIKYRGPDSQVIDITATGWIGT